MNSLQKLIQQRMQALGIESYSELGRRAGLPRSTVWALGTTEHRTTLPKDLTLEAVAGALGLTTQELRQAAYASLGENHVDDSHDLVRVVGKDFRSLPPTDQDHINSAVRKLVARRLQQRASIEEELEGLL